MNIRIANLPPGVTEEELTEFLGASDDIEEIEITDAGNADKLVALLKVNTSHTGAVAMAEFIDGRFFKDRRLTAQALTLLND